MHAFLMSILASFAILTTAGDTVDYACDTSIHALQAALPSSSSAAVAVIYVSQAQSAAVEYDIAQGTSEADCCWCLEAVVVVCCKQGEENSTHKAIACLMC